MLFRSKVKVRFRHIWFTIDEPNTVNKRPAPAEVGHERQRMVWLRSMLQLIIQYLQKYTAVTVLPPELQHEGALKGTRFRSEEIQWWYLFLSNAALIQSWCSLNQKVGSRCFRRIERGCRKFECIDHGPKVSRNNRVTLQDGDK